MVSVLVILAVSLGFAQFKEQIETKPDVYQSIVRGEWGSKLFIRHAFSASYISIGGKGMLINSYTNSIFYRFSDNLNLQADISFVNSPFSSFGRSFQRGINGIYINRVELNYRPLNNVLINIQYRQLPFYDFYYYGW